MCWKVKRTCCLILVGYFLWQISLNLNAQESKERSLTLLGTVETNMNPLTNAKITIIKNGNVERTLYAGSDGKFNVVLDLNSEYTILFEKDGFLGKKIFFNTKVPDDVFNKWTNEFAVSLFKGCEGVSTSVLDQPVDRIQFSVNKMEFVSDKAYVESMQQRIENLQNNIENCKENQYQTKIMEADKLFNASQYEQARGKYEEALKVIPDDKYAEQKIKEIDKKIGQSQQAEQRYNEIIKEADQLFTAKNYSAARDKYVEASAIMPQNTYPKDKITEIDNLLKAQNQQDQEKSENEKKYTNLISRANTAYSLQNYEEAKDLYTEALTIKPSAVVPQQKIAELNKLIADQKQKQLDKDANDKAYNEALVMGQAALQANDLQAAKQHFNRALVLKPDATLPKQKIDEIDHSTEQKKQSEIKSQKAAKEEKITASLDEGDKQYNSKNYDAAEAAYQDVLKLDPTDEYAKQRVAKIESFKLASQAEKQKTLEKSVNENVAKGDEMVKAASYQQAVEAYKQALLLKPDDITLKNKLSAAEQKLADDQQRQAIEQGKKKQYDEKLNQGNNLFASQQYAEAKAAYEAAGALYPDQAYPRNKIAEIDKIQADQLKQSQYNAAISQADQQFAAKNYSEAKINYQHALLIKPGEQYPAGQVTKIDALLADQAKMENDAKAREQKYNTTITQADQLFAAQKLIEAKTYYQNALLLKPGEQYATSQVAKIDAMLAEQLKKENDAKAKEQQFNIAIKQADQLFAAQKLADARTYYQQALAIKPGDPYTTGQISKIDAQLTDQLKKENESKAREQQYNTIITQADQLFATQKLLDAKTYYQQALAVKPGDPYTTGQISKIDAQLADQLKKENDAKAREQQYNAAVKQADQLFATQKLVEAKTYYQQALLIKPGDQYPTSQMTKIEAMIAEQQKKESDAKAKELQYTTAITQADQLYTAQKLAESRSYYQQALAIKPGEKYPADQVAKLDAQLALIDKQNQDKAATDKKYNDLITQADKAYDIKDFKTAKPLYNQAIEMRPLESYPKDRLNKISEYEKMMAQEEASRKTTKATPVNAEKSKPAAEPLADLKFANEGERQKYLDGLKRTYPVGVTLEVHHEKTRTIQRYVIIRDDVVREFRKVVYNWGGTDFSLNGIPCTGMYFDTQVRTREGESYKEIDY